MNKESYSSPKISVVIRALNEKSYVQAWIQYLRTNAGQYNLEIIIVDNESTDGTSELAVKAGCKVVNIPRNEYTHPKAMNAGVRAATADIVVLTVAHAYPTRKDWLAQGVKYFGNPNVAGVYGPCAAGLKPSSIERVVYGFDFWRRKIRGYRSVKKIQMGVFGATCHMLRRDLWLQHPFDETFGGGGEDTQWAKWALGKGYSIIEEPNFSVHHSHGLGPIGLVRQYRRWMAMAYPTKFNKSDGSYGKWLPLDNKEIN